MSIYIPGISMPTSCYDCPCANGDRMRCQVAKRDFGFFEATRPDWCPLIPVPEHGRLIDADALEKDIDKYIGGEESRSRFHHWVQVQSVVIPVDKGEET